MEFMKEYLVMTLLLFLYLFSWGGGGGRDGGEGRGRKNSGVFDSVSHTLLKLCHKLYD